MADDRFQKATSDSNHTVDTLHKEQERVVKIESIKKSLEVEVISLTTFSLFAVNFNDFFFMN